MFRADEVIAGAVEQKVIFEVEVAQTEQHLVLLQAKAAATTPAVVPEPVQVKELQTSGEGARRIELCTRQAG